MTENKRFILHINWFNKEKTEGEALLKDNGQPLLLTESIPDARLLKDILNELNDENINIKKQLNEECENCIYYSHKKVMTVINDAIATERTSIGKSVLKQLKEQIT